MRSVVKPGAKGRFSKSFVYSCTDTECFGYWKVYHQPGQRVPILIGRWAIGFRRCWARKSLEADSQTQGTVSVVVHRALSSRSCARVSTGS